MEPSTPPETVSAQLTGEDETVPTGAPVVDLAALTPEQDAAMVAIEDAAKAEAIAKDVARVIDAVAPSPLAGVLTDIDARIRALPHGARVEVEHEHGTAIRVVTGSARGHGAPFGFGATVADALTDAGY